MVFYIELVILTTVSESMLLKLYTLGVTLAQAAPSENYPMKFQPLVDFVKGKGWTAVAISGLGGPECAQLMKEMSLKSVSTNSKIANELPLIFFGGQNSTVPEHLVTLRDAFKTVIVAKSTNFTSFKSASSLGLFLTTATLLSDKMMQRVIGTREEMKVTTFPIGREPKLNGQNLTISCDSLPYPPYLDFDEEKAIGFQPELLSEIGRRMNFRIGIGRVAKEIGWGGAVDESDLNTSQVGVFGMVARGQIDISAAPWVSDVDRFQFVGFSQLPVKIPTLYCYASKANIASGTGNMLLAKPLTFKSWTLVAFMFALASLIHELGLWYKSEKGIEMAALVAGLSFTVVIGYFSGALTMFLVPSLAMPFQTSNEGLANPDWNVIIPSDVAGVFSLFFNTKDAIVKETEEQLRSGGSERFYLTDDMEEALARLQNLDTFLLATDDRINPALESVGKENLPSSGIARFCQPRTFQYLAITSKWSPFLPLLNEGLLNLKETNMQARLEAKWFGRDTLGSQSSLPPTAVLSVSHIKGTLALPIIVAICCLMILALEHLSKKKGVEQSYRHNHNVRRPKRFSLAQ